MRAICWVAASCLVLATTTGCDIGKHLTTSVDPEADCAPRD
jgi:hypothetical protein